MIKSRFSSWTKFVCMLITLVFGLQCLIPARLVSADVSILPTPGAMVNLSPAFVPALLRGVTVHPENPLQFEFIVDSGNEKTTLDKNFTQNSQRLVNYFLSSMTVPEKDLWVNLSPNEPDRIVPKNLGQTQLGRDLLAQDYILKQLTASLIQPDGESGRELWEKIYSSLSRDPRFRGDDKFLDIPSDIFNKVWILPESATIYEHNNTVYITDAKLKVMTDQDYVAGQHNRSGEPVEPQNYSRLQDHPVTKTQNNVSTQLIQGIIIPEIEKEVNTGKNFTQLRQIYYSLILAKWYKDVVRNSILDKVYIGKNMVNTLLPITSSLSPVDIYKQYMSAFKQGVYEKIREEYDPKTQKIIARKYFSGGFTDSAMIIHHASANQIVPVGEQTQIKVHLADAAQISTIASPFEIHHDDYPQLLASLLKVLKIEEVEEDLFSSDRNEPKLIRKIEGKVNDDFFAQIYKELKGKNNLLLGKLEGQYIEASTVTIYLQKKESPILPNAFRVHVSANYALDIILENRKTLLDQNEALREQMKFASVINGISSTDLKENLFADVLGEENRVYFKVFRTIRKEMAVNNDEKDIFQLMKDEKSTYEEFLEKFKSKLKASGINEDAQNILNRLKIKVDDFIAVNDVLMELVNRSVHEGYIKYYEALRVMFMSQIRVGVVPDSIVRDIKANSVSMVVNRSGMPDYFEDIQFNPSRALRAAMAKLKPGETNLSKAFTKKWFPLQRWVFYQRDGMDVYRIGANPFPHLNNSINIVHDDQVSQIPSQSTLEDMLTLLNIMKSFGRNVNFRLFLNAMFAGFSFDHLHYQGFLKITHVEKTLNDDTLISQGINTDEIEYLTPKEGAFWLPSTFVLKGRDANKMSSAIIDILRHANPATRELQLKADSEFSYNILFTLDDNEEYRIFIFARTFNPQKPEDPTNKMEKTLEIKDKEGKVIFSGRPAGVEFADTLLYGSPGDKQNFETVKNESILFRQIVADLGKQLTYPKFDALIQDIKNDLKLKPKTDSALLAGLSDKGNKAVLNKSDVGGIDMSTVSFKRKDGLAPKIVFNLDPAMLERMQSGDFKGFQAIITDVIPLPSVLPLLGLSPFETKSGDEKIGLGPVDRFIKKLSNA
ncbi:MAG: hypothetical protein HQL26_05015 [Candidatus Omnitrophica bacterium]|nr:hypothetical protein [Candidatus Omnitrophota bacterium]